MDENLAGRVAAIAALDEPTRRRCYEHVVHQPAPVSRDEVAEALGIPRATVAFHLDRLVERDLLDVTFERRTGRSGPGAGRPAKLYRRAERDLAVSLPDRHYDLAAHLLAAAVEEADDSGEPVRTLLDQQAYQLGAELGRAAGDTSVLAALEAHGFEPRPDGSAVVLANCPFHALARQHAELVCGMNRNLLNGFLTGLGQTGLRAEPDPAPGRCCVKVTRVRP